MCWKWSNCHAHVLSVWNSVSGTCSASFSCELRARKLLNWFKLQGSERPDVRLTMRLTAVNFPELLSLLGQRLKHEHWERGTLGQKANPDRKVWGTAKTLLGLKSRTDQPFLKRRQRIAISFHCSFHWSQVLRTNVFSIFLKIDFKKHLKVMINVNTDRLPGTPLAGCTLIPLHDT